MVDKYVLVRFEDYQRLISAQVASRQHLDTKTYYHSQEGGLSESRPQGAEQRPEGQLATTIKSSAGGQLSGGGGQSPASKEVIDSGEESGPEVAGNGTSWFDIWEGLHFEK